MQLTAFRFFRSPSIIAFGLFLGSAAIVNLQAENTEQDRSNRKSQESVGRISREGTKVKSQRAVCRLSGDRLSIQFAGSKDSIGALENLSAQRIVQAIEEDAGDTNWVVSGTLTEFQNNNYILLERVMRHSSR